MFPLYQGTLTSEKWSRVFYNLANQRNFVLPITINTFDIGNSFRVTAGSGLTVNIAEGYAFVGGHLIYESGGSVNVPASSTSYIYVEIQKDGNRTIGVSYLVSSNSNLESQDRMLLATVTTGSTSVSSVVDMRKSVIQNYVVPVKLETSTSTTLNYLDAKAVYLRVQALGGGGGGASYVDTLIRHSIGGGVGGGYCVDDDLYIGGVQIQVQVGAGGTGGSNSYGGSGGNSVITVRDKDNTVLKTYTAQGGAGGQYRVNQDMPVVMQEFNYEGITRVSSPASTKSWTWMPSASGLTIYASPFSTPVVMTNANQFATLNTRFFGGGTGGYVFRNVDNTATRFSPQPSALVWGGAGGQAGGIGFPSPENGQAPAGGGGALLGTAQAGNGANGAVRLDILVFY